MDNRGFRAFVVLSALYGACAAEGDESSSTPVRPAQEPLVFVAEHVTSQSPLGLWCVARAGDEFVAKPIVVDAPDVSDVTGELLKLGDRYWLSYGSSEEAWAAPLTGCKPEAPRSIHARDVLWSNARAVYLHRDKTNGALRAGVPGEEPTLIEPADIAEARWSPTANVAFYMHANRLFTLELEENADVSLIPVAQDVRQATWSSDSEWLVFQSGDEKHISAWSRSSHEVKVLAESAEPFGYFSISPDARFVLIWGGKPTDRRLVSLADGSSEKVLDANVMSTNAMWLAPEPWLLHLSVNRVTLTLYDFEAGAPGSELVLSNQVAYLSPIRGQAITMSTGDEPAHWISGLPRAQQTLGPLHAVSGGAFSASGKQWAALDEAKLQVVRASSIDDVEQVADFGEREPSQDGVRWIDENTLALIVTDPGRQTLLAIAEHDGKSWDVKELALPGRDSSGPRLMAASANPCEVQAVRRSQHELGCVFPER